MTLYWYIRICFAVHQLMFILVVWFVRIKLQWTHIYESLCGHAFIVLGMVRSYVKCMFNFVRNCWTLSRVVYHFIFPPTRYEVSSFSVSSVALNIVCLFDDSHASWYIVLPHYVLICICLLNNAIEYLFIYLFPIHVSSLVSIHIFCLNTSIYQVYMIYMICKYFLSVVGLSVSFISNHL